MVALSDDHTEHSPAFGIASEVRALIPFGLSHIPGPEGLFHPLKLNAAALDLEQRVRIVSNHARRAAGQVLNVWSTLASTTTRHTSGMAWRA